MCQGWEMSGFPSLLFPLTILLDSTSRVWKICSTPAIVLSELSMRDQGFVSSVGGSGVTQKQSGSSSRSPQMSNVFLLSHQTLNL
jgi:hypothetical protein